MATSSNAAKTKNRGSRKGTAKASGGDAKTAGKRRSVRERVGSSRLLSTPATIMGPRLLFVFSIVALSILGLIMVYSASSITAYNQFHNASYYFDRQVVFLAIGVVLCVVVAAVPYRFWGSLPVFMTLWVLSCLLLAASALGGGVSALGAERSIMIGSFALQPSEFAKIAVLLTVASLIQMYRAHAFDIRRFGLLTLIAVGIPMILIYRQPDLGTAIILAVGILAILVLAGVTWKFVAVLFAVGAAYVVFACVTQPYHLDRIVAMFNPWVDPQGDGYQSIQSLYAFGSGGLFGTGLGLSRQKYLYLPYAHTDFIFSVIGEELGLVGTLAVVALFAVFVYSGMRISRSAPDLFGCLIAGGMTVMIGFQACVNMAQACGIAPVTGKALPFLSYGGSSLVATFIMCGIVISVSMRSVVGAAHERKRDNFLVYDSGRGKGKAAEKAPEKTSGKKRRPRPGQGQRPPEGDPQRQPRRTRDNVVSLHEPVSHVQKGEYRYGQSIYTRRRGNRHDGKR